MRNLLLIVLVLVFFIAGYFAGRSLLAKKQKEEVTPVEQPTLTVEECQRELESTLVRWSETPYYDTVLGKESDKLWDYIDGKEWSISPSTYTEDRWEELRTGYDIHHGHLFEVQVSTSFWENGTYTHQVAVIPSVAQEATTIKEEKLRRKLERGMSYDSKDWLALGFSESDSFYGDKHDAQVLVKEVDYEGLLYYVRVLFLTEHFNGGAAGTRWIDVHTPHKR